MISSQRKIGVAVAATAWLCGAASLSHAQEATEPSGIRFGPNADRWEVRLGGAIYDTGPFTPQTLSGGVINAEVLAPSPEFLGWIWSPRPYLGMDIALSDEPIHVFYAGLNWETYLTKKLYVGFGAGGSVNTKTRGVKSPNEIKDLGSHILFHLQASIGYDITENLTAQIYLNHFSNAKIVRDNDGIESVGARLGWRF